MNRRNFIQKSIIGALIAPMIDLDSLTPTASNTTFIANYDTESASCLEHLESIVKMHLKHQVPATFFIVSDILNNTNKDRVIKLLDHPLFEIGSHSKGHNLILPHPLQSKTGKPRVELIDSKKRLEDIFQKPIIGYATPYAYVNGFKGHKEILSIVQEAGYKYISTICWGPGFSLPAPIIEPFTYEADGFNQIWEIPKHGWHENVLKGHTKVDNVALLNWPSSWPQGAIPSSPIQTPIEEFEVNKVFIDYATKLNRKHLTLAWHPWSIGRFDPKLIALDRTFSYLKTKQMKSDTFEGLYKKLVTR